MKAQIHPAVFWVIIIALAGIVAYAGWRYTSPRTPAGVKYTPGVPPWLDKSGNQPVIPGKPSGPGGPPVISPSGDMGRK
ncbi:MAG: hypothetical protein FJX72_09090 [Armatimonadetes bacterium]|nr:hypothetical protein [Armatimonadota bacterium]